MLTYQNYLDIAKDVLKLLERKRQQVLMELGETRTHNFLVQTFKELGVKSDVVTWNEESRVNNLASVNDLIEFFTGLFALDPQLQHTTRKDYLVCARTILRYVELELKAHVDTLKQLDASYARELDRYNADKDIDYGLCGHTQRKPDPPHQKYTDAVNRWQHILQTIIEVFINRGIPQV